MRNEITRIQNTTRVSNTVTRMRNLIHVTDKHNIIIRSYNITTLAHNILHASLLHDIITRERDKHLCTRHAMYYTLARHINSRSRPIFPHMSPLCHYNPESMPKQQQLLLRSSQKKLNMHHNFKRCLPKIKSCQKKKIIPLKCNPSVQLVNGTCILFVATIWAVKGSIFWPRVEQGS